MTTPPATRRNQGCQCVVVSRPVVRTVPRIAAVVVVVLVVLGLFQPPLRTAEDGIGRGVVVVGVEAAAAAWTYSRSPLVSPRTTKTTTTRPRIGERTPNGGAGAGRVITRTTTPFLYYNNPSPEDPSSSSSGRLRSSRVPRHGMSRSRRGRNYYYDDDDKVLEDFQGVSSSFSASFSASPIITTEDSYATTSNTNNNKNVVVEAFHRDMRRVLESRRTASLEGVTSSSSSSSRWPPPVEEQEKVVVVRRGGGGGGGVARRSSTSSNSSSSSSTPNNNKHRHNNNNNNFSDTDGAERCLCMLQHLKHTLHAANEQSFQIVMHAFLQRGRTRWRDTTAARGTSTSNSPLLCAADQLERLLQELEDYLAHQQQQQQQLDGTTTATTTSISTKTYNYVLEAYAVCATPYTDYATRARILLQQRMARPNLESHLHVVHALAWQQANRQPAAEAQEAHDILRQDILSHNNSNDNDDTILSTAVVQMQAYAYVLEAWSKSLSGAPRCMDLLQEMKQLNATHPDARVAQYLDPEAYSNAIVAWSKQEVNNNNSSTQHLHHAAEQAHAMLLELWQHIQQGSFGPAAVPPLIAFNSVITAWGRAQRTDQVEWVLQLLQQARQCHPSILQPEAVLYNSILHSFLSGPLPPRVALEKSLQLLYYMQEESRSGRQPRIAPDAYSYYTLLKCWIQSGNNNNNNNKNNRRQQQKTLDDDANHRPRAAEQAEALLHLMEERWNARDTSVQPSRLIYNMVINAYAKSQHPQAAPRALELLRRMKDSPFEDCQPDIISYTSCLECLSKPNCSLPNPAAMAQQLLQEAETRYRAMSRPTQPRDARIAQQQQQQQLAEQQQHFMPNLRTYTMAIQTLANHGGSVWQAREWLTQLCDDYQRTSLPSLKPNTYPYNYVLNCAANTAVAAAGDGEADGSARRLQAFQIAAQTFQEMRHSGSDKDSSNHHPSTIQPDSFSYTFWFKCCHNLLAPGSDLQRQCAQLAWKECQHRGLVTEHVVQRYQQMMGLGGGGSWNDDSENDTAALSRRSVAQKQTNVNSTTTTVPSTTHQRQ